MALSPIYSISSIAPSTAGSVTNLIDETVYGGANPARNTYAVYLLANKVSETDSGLQEDGLVVQAYDPLTADAWVVENTIDGYQKFIFFTIPIYSPAVVYNQYSIVYYEGVIYQTVSAAPVQGIIPTEGANWVVTTISQIYAMMDTATEPPNLILSILGTVLTYEGQRCLGIYAPLHAKANCGGCAGDPAIKEKFEDLWLLVFNANIASLRQKFIEGERFMRSAELYCDCN